MAQTKTIKNFELKGVDNQFVSLDKYADAKGFIVVFTCNKCPMAKFYKYPKTIKLINSQIDNNLLQQFSIVID